MSNESYYVAVIGAGPAGMFAARELARNGAKVVIFNRDIKPGGLAEYGIYFDKYAMKEGLRTQFKQVLETPGLTYYGNVTLGTHGDLTLEDLHNLGFQAVLVTVGAQGTKWLGLPGEELTGMTRSNTESTVAAVVLMSDVDRQVSDANQTLEHMMVSMNEINASAEVTTSLVLPPPVAVS